MAPPRFSKRAEREGIRTQGTFRACPIIGCSDQAQISNKIIRKGLAFRCVWSGSVAVLSAKRIQRSCPAGCTAEMGLRWCDEKVPPTEGGSRCRNP